MPGLREYQVFQRDEARLEVAVPGITQKDKEAILREFAALFAAYDIPNDSVSIEFINYRETGIRKLKRISRDSREMKGTV